MNIQVVKIKDIKNNPNNPRIIKDDKFKKLVASIREFPKMLEIRPIVVNDDMIVLGGNMRLKAIKELGLTEVPVIKISDLTDEQQRQFIIKDNAGFGEWDWNMLANEWDTDELEKWGLDLPDFVQTELEAVEDYFEVNENTETDIVIGDLFEIGEHRLLCGDSTDSDAVAKLMDGQKADMVFTDPPYLMDFTGGIHADGSKSFNSKHGGIKNDKMSKDEGDDFLDAINSNIQLFVNGAFYICFYRLKLGEYFESLKRTGLDVRALITWNKGNHTLSNSDYMSKCEHIFYGWVNEHNFYGGNNGMDIWEIPRTQKNELHPTMKPIPLCEKAINDASKLNDIVLDLFLGSGSTMVASQQLKRKCYGMELDPKYCQVIIDRMKKLDDSLVIKRNGITMA
jgi:site-specific DNA-methyltransferase (adenine-specific)